MLTRNSKLKTCCFIERRPQILPLKFNEKNIDIIKFKKIVREIIINLIEKYNVTHYISGVSLGVEQYASETVLELKKQYPQITLECAIPHEMQAADWTESQRNKYFSIIKDCDKETLMQFQCTNDSIQNLNKYLIKSSNYIIQICYEEPNKTARTEEFEKIQGKNVFIITL